MYNLRLFELLHKLPQPSQDKIAALAQEDTDRFCDKYDLTLTYHKDTAYRYYLSTRVRFAWFNGVSFEHADPIDIVELGEIQDYYKKRLEWLLNDDIRSKASQRSVLLKEDLRQPLEELVF